MITYGAAFKPFLPSSSSSSFKSVPSSSSTSSSSQPKSAPFTSPSRQKDVTVKQPDILADYGDTSSAPVEKKGKEEQLGQDKEYFESNVWRSEISAEPLADPE
eukprot:TRINITY_DN24960_c0_g1_i6.p1 TRINITY_DN24960_c0_g1~~TRINITY_DN24960_c0_g1_i6.p1  ORF type:complete len:111 (-),score=15.86 TRINITY_DN24960_c0_g1_i6:81-389(-)